MRNKNGQHSCIIYSYLSVAKKKMDTSCELLPIVSIVDLLGGIVSLSDAILRCGVNKSKSVHPAEFDNSPILKHTTS